MQRTSIVEQQTATMTTPGVRVDQFETKSQIGLYAKAEQ
jgi:hypothetical protein